MKKSALGLRPAADACLTISSDLVISWYELFVQLPMRPAPKVLGQSFSSIRGEGSVDVGFELGEVDFDDLVVGSFWVRSEEVLLHGRVGDLGGLFGDRASVCRLEIGNV
jgi:hypothetical protein